MITKKQLKQAKNLEPVIDFLGEDRLIKLGFKIRRLDVDLIENGWIRIHVRWSDHDYKFREVRRGGATYGLEKTLNLDFPRIRYVFSCTKNKKRTRFTTSPQIRIGLVSKDMEKFDWTPRFFEKPIKLLRREF